MKKIIAVILCAAMLCALSGCTSGNSGDVSVTAEPDDLTESASGLSDDTDEEESMPVIDAEAPAIHEVEASEYSYTAFSLDNGFSMDVPSHWERQPASKSVCFTEPVQEGKIPGRIVVSSKTVDKVGGSTRESQLKSFFSKILAGFETYEWSDIYTSQPFMGDDEALSVTYTASRDGQQYKGYVIICAKGNTIFVYHFRCSEEAYPEMQEVSAHVRDSITIKK